MPLRLNLVPAAIINIRTEPLLATGPVVGKYFYGKTFSIVNLRDSDFDFLKNGMDAAVYSRKKQVIRPCIVSVGGAGDS